MSSTSDNGLICAYLIDDRGAGRELGWDEIRAWQPGQGLLWVHLDFTHAGSAQWLRSGSGLAESIADALLAEDGRPRSLRQGDDWLVMLRGVNLTPGAEPEDMVAVRVWLEAGRIISTRRRVLQSMRDVRDAVESGRGPTSSGEFLELLVEGLVGRIDAAVESIEEEIEQSESDMVRDSSLALQMRIAQLRRRCARMRRHLGPQREALERLVRDPGGCVAATNAAMIREISDQMTRVLEDLDLARERAMVAHEEFVARVAQEQNSRVYLLSIVAAIFLPLSFLTGLFGMNVAGLPGMEDPRAFLLVTGIMLGLAVAALVVFRWKRWI
jgi:zinc transporter